ncbi:MAG: 4'-phosphopantetheinyl transferase superfamily protein [Acidobacteria bacterium]|nr:4'-phosphopantetheinyl transferase superfamily protein [Acidobacteriota bacterium]
MTDTAACAASNRLASCDLLVRYVKTDGCDEGAFAQLRPQLTPDELARAARFHFARDRVAFAVGHVLVRRTLSEQTSAPPSGWSFVSNAHGKPEVQPSAGGTPWRFNISHCAGMVMTGFARDRDIGVDVESADRFRAGLEIARFCFAPEEVRAIESASEHERRTTCAAVWTLKEAYIKARGLGLTIPLADFAIDLGSMRIWFSARIADQADCWLLWRDQVGRSHMLAVAARRRPDEQLRMRVEEVALESLWSISPAGGAQFTESVVGDRAGRDGAGSVRDRAR